MGDAGRRILMAAVGIATLLVYGAGAYLSYRLVAAAWTRRPDTVTILVAVVAGTIVAGYLSYVYGTARILGGLGAIEIPRDGLPGLYARLDRLSARMAIEPPRIYVADLPVPNALSVGGATGGAVVIDRALFELLSADEIEAVIAHELAHLEGRDGLVQTLAFSAVESVAGVITLVLLPALLLLGGVARGLAWFRGDPGSWYRGFVGGAYRGIGGIVAIVLAVLTLLTFAHSRRREFAADDRAVSVTGKPVALVRALRTIERASEPRWSPLSTLYVRGEEDPLAKWLSTHPSMDDRIERIRERVELEGRRAQAAR